MKDTTGMLNRHLMRKRYGIVGDFGTPPQVYYSPQVTYSGTCYMGQTPEFLLPDYEFTASRPNRLMVENPYTPLPGIGYYPPVAGNLRTIDRFDNDPQAMQTINTIRHPYRRIDSERKRPQGVFTMHGFRKFKTNKQVDPDLEEMYKIAKYTIY